MLMKMKKNCKMMHVKARWGEKKSSENLTNEEDDENWKWKQLLHKQLKNNSMKITRQIFVCFSHFHLLQYVVLGVLSAWEMCVWLGGFVDLLMMENVKMFSYRDRVYFWSRVHQLLQWLCWWAVKTASVGKVFSAYFSWLLFCTNGKNDETL